MKRVTIVGMSLAGLRAAETLRRSGFDATITAIGAESWVPYDRPPLSKEFLTKTRSFADISLRREGYDNFDAELRLGVRAVGLNVVEHSVALDDGSAVEYDELIIATGTEPRRLPPEICDPNLHGVHYLRTYDDAVALRRDIVQAGRVCVIGAGFIGAEIAASCRALGVAVTMLEAQAQPMIRGLGETLGSVCAQLHRDHGVDVRLGVQISSVHGEETVDGVRLVDGTDIACDVVVIGIGVEPSTGWLQGSGLEIDNGIVCDEFCIAAPNVFAAGDVARWPNSLFDGELMRLEHWTNAVEQGAHVAETIVSGEPTSFAPVPFVWSDQYDCKIHSVGRFSADDEFTIVRGSLESRKFVALFGRNGRLTGALGFSQPRHVMIARRQIAERVSYADAVNAANA